MKNAIALLLVLTSTCSLAQQPSISGVFDGRVHRPGGTRWSDFSIDLAAGTIVMYRADRACRQPQSIRVVKDSQGLRLESTGEGVTMGCERVFHDLVITDTGFTGKMTASTGNGTPRPRGSSLV